MPVNIYLAQLGCRLNFSENHQLARALQGAGHAVVHHPEQAQLAVVNTCAVTVAASGKSRRLIRHLHRSNPDLRIVATGCHSTLEPTATGNLPGVWRVVPNEDKDLLPTLLQAWSAELPDADTLLRLEPDGSPLPQDAGGRSRAFVKVQDGCENRCTFCVVTLARGAGRSRPANDVVLEIQSLVDEGFQEAVLTGVHLGSWGRDLEPGRLHLADLVHQVLAETDIPRLRLSSLEPWDIPDGFFELWQAWPGRLCPHLHLPSAVRFGPYAAAHGPALHAGRIQAAGGGCPRCRSGSGDNYRHHRRFPGRDGAGLRRQPGIHRGDCVCGCARVPLQCPAGHGCRFLWRADAQR